MGFGNLFKQQNTLTNFSNSMAQESAQQQQTAAQTQSNALIQQGNVAYTQAAQNEALFARQNDIEAGQQTQQYLSAGVQDVGTPMQVVNETRAVGQLKINAMEQQGQLEQDLLYAKANIAQNQGNQAYLTGQAQVFGNDMENEINQQETKTNFYSHLGSGIAEGGLSILPPVLDLLFP